ncbi:MAG TPA: hypothetical protein VJX67_03435, partial [Blastocatellia bacterium]|nr:hypothetical protein [Blastocatellia bacterium]
ERIIGAARYMDAIFERQVWSGNVALEKKLEANHTPTGRELLHYFRINAGPWSRLDEDKPFIAGVPQVKPPEGTFYPDGMTREEFNDWVKTLPDKDKADATSFFSVIRRGPDGKLKSVPYSQEYKPFLDPASKLLAEAAGLTTNPSLKAFLTKRAEAFHSNDYYDSDVAWMDLDSPIDLTIGPYETYEDGLFNYKAAFEAFVTLRDEGESAKLAKFSTYLQDIENNLPEDPKYRNPRLGAGAPIRVVNEVFASGDGNRGVQTAAFNLPNDPKIVNERGAKRVMLKNVQQAKFDKILLPISRVCLSKSDQKDLSFEAFFTHILAHELMHGLGPHTIQVNGRETSVGLELKDQYSAIEEAKADITGLFALGYLMDKGVVDKSLGRYLYTTYLASAFRSVRFGITEAHGKGVALQFNYLVEKGAIKYDARSGLFTIDNTRIKDAVRDLTHDLLTIEAEGSYDGAKAILDKYGVIGPEMKSTLERLKGVPVDIEPFFPIAARVQGPRK